MKDQYFGDIDDYRKYGLLRCFAGAGLRLGVCWMLTPSDTSRNGSKVDYLSKPETWRRRDPQLFDLLKHKVEGNRRSVHEFETTGLLPGATVFSDLLPEGVAERGPYFAQALTALGEADVLFFDPDNGLEVPSTPYGRKGSTRYLYWREVDTVARGNASASIFQYWKRENRQTLRARLSDELHSRMPEADLFCVDSPFALFLAACQRGHRGQFASALRLLNDRWNGDLEANV